MILLVVNSSRKEHIMCSQQDESNIQDDPDVKGDSEVQEVTDAPEESEDAASQDEVAETAEDQGDNESGTAEVADEQDSADESEAPNEPVEPGTPREHKEGEAFHLEVGQITPQDSVVAVRWCVCPDKIQELKDAGAKNLHILISVNPRKGGVEQRKLVPIEKAMTYISFLSPGMHLIQATLLSGRDVKKMKALILEKHTDSVYENKILNFEGILKTNEDRFWSDERLRNTGYEVVEMEVPEEFFAKEPPKWLSNWVNAFFTTSPVDQCSFRRRCIFAFTLQPFIFAIAMVFLYATSYVMNLAWLSVGRGIRLKALVLPLSFDPDEFFTPPRKNSLFANKWLWPFMPLPWMVAGTVTTLILTFGYGLGFLSALTYVAIFVVGGAIGILALAAIIYLIFWAVFSSESAQKRLAKWRKKKNEAKWAAAEALRKEREKEIWDKCPSCPGEILGTEIEDLPKELRSFKLRFTRLKGKVCRPFSK
jgi:hypothetical protein